MTDLYTHRIEIYTSSLLITGAYELAIYRPVVDALNGEQRAYIPLRDATVAPLERAQLIQRVPQLLVDRKEIVLVAVLEEAPPPADYIAPEAARGVAPAPIMCFTSAFVVRAALHKRPDLSLADTLDRQTDDFLTLSGAQVFPLLGGFAPIKRAIAALRRERIVALYHEGEPPRPPVGAPPDEQGSDSTTSDEASTSDSAP